MNNQFAAQAQVQLPATQQERLLGELQRLRAENTRLRKRLAGARGDVRRVHQAYHAADLLLRYHLMGQVTSRRNGPLPARAWEAAVALLKVARLYIPHYGIMPDLTPEQYRLKLDRGYERALLLPELWRSYLVPSRRRKSGNHLRKNGGHKEGCK